MLAWGGKLKASSLLVLTVVTACFLCPGTRVSSMNISPGDEFAIARSSSDEYSPFINSDFAIFSEKSGGITSAKSFNLSDGSLSAIFDDKNGAPSFSSDELCYISQDYCVTLKNSSCSSSSSWISAYNFKSKVTTTISNTPATRDCVSVWDKYAVWTETDVSNPGVYIADITNASNKTRIYDFVSDDQWCWPLIHEGNIVYQSYNSSDSDIKYYTISTQTTQTIANSSAFEKNPVIQGDYVYYTSHSPNLDSFGEIKGHRISTGETFDVWNNPDNCFLTLMFSPESEILVIKVFNFDNSKEKLMGFEPVKSTLFDITPWLQEGCISIASECGFGRKIVWIENRRSENEQWYKTPGVRLAIIDSDDNLKIFDITGQNDREPIKRYWARIYDDNIVWAEDNGLDWDIYGFRIKIQD
ncbi:MAG: hypothetical protein GYA78_00710 [Caldisericales bacterium]|nr:hypothetical protein [Caldisericia bacterium]NMD13862.1 hypothetical protein [Caldisericales bacterium]